MTRFINNSLTLRGAQLGLEAGLLEIPATDVPAQCGLGKVPQRACGGRERSSLGGLFDANQDDLSVWETLAHLARQQPLGHPCEFTAHGLLKSLGLHTGLSQHKQLHSTIIRLTACAVEITHEGKTYFGSLVT